MADDELDSLYAAPPKDFTAQRTKLAAAAKRRGDDAGAKRISAANKPTSAAWIVNRLALRDADTKRRLTDLGDRLRAAHAAMDGARIRDLSAEQHQLVGELTRAALQAADVSNPSSAVRDDITSTLQAAIADPEVRERLGRLARPEQWSGFADFGAAAPVTAARTGKAKERSVPSRPQPAKQPPRAAAVQRRLEKLTAAVTAAEREQADAEARLSERRAERTAARQRREEALAAVRTAERELERAEAHYERAKQASRAAGESVKEAKAQLKRG
ncbi:hypothetical protein [Mycobacterium sp. 852002-30065_SCH5024008]|uniref:hypothetical protein n=1 Tax=Mycobacterium sp. 852002-30065_SCH5024008 TaxID=1834088 RepID=UPI0007FCD2AC|nr:hypothetical protein [Mycobacterium sp. 852002-30065_SCH5024008]OBB90399.1 hypothetical protein A5781_23505 [Mycobacterium sp. 852002-30065_SCH5024008]